MHMLAAHGGRRRHTAAESGASGCAALPPVDLRQCHRLAASALFGRLKGRTSVAARANGSVSGKWAASGVADSSKELHEVDQLLNDPDLALDAHRVWSLLAKMTLNREPPNKSGTSEQD